MVGPFSGPFGSSFTVVGSLRVLLGSLRVLGQTGRVLHPVWVLQRYSIGCEKSAVHRSAVRSNASSKFLQNYAGRRVRQPRTPNTSAARVVANLITINTVVSRKLFHPRLPHADVGLLLFAPDATRSVTGKHKHNKQTKRQKDKGDNVLPLSVCLMLSDTAALVH